MKWVTKNIFELIIRKPFEKIKGTGIHEQYLQYDGLIISIAQKLSNGKKKYPNKFYVSRETIMSCPAHFNLGEKNYAVPFTKMTELIKKQGKNKKKTKQPKLF